MHSLTAAQLRNDAGDVLSQTTYQIAVEAVDRVRESFQQSSGSHQAVGEILHLKANIIYKKEAIREGWPSY